MAWTKVFEENVTYEYRTVKNSTGSFIDIDESLYDQLSEASSVKLSIEGRDPEVLPVMTQPPRPNIIFFGEGEETGGTPIFDTYNSCLYIGLDDDHYPYMDISFNAEITEERSLNTIIEIGEGDPTPTPTPKKTSKVLGVKEAMQHYVSTLDAVAAPATTIKKLTKQALDPDGNNESIQKARTIAEIWEAAAIEGGYKPPVEGAAVVGQAVVGQAVVTSEGNPTPEEA